MNARHSLIPWFGSPHGFLSDWITQCWVQFTGRYVDLGQDAWLSGPMGKPAQIGKDFFRELASEEGLEVRNARPEGGLISDFHALSSPTCDTTTVNPSVIDFYEHTAGYDLDAWSQWCGPFRPFGLLLAVVFSRRLQQLNVPLSSLDTSQGITSDVIQLLDRNTGEIVYTAWVRELMGSRNVLYAGSYSFCPVPGHAGHCIKVVFPLPNGNAIVVMKPEHQADGSFSLTSEGHGFGWPGFYFVVRNADGSISARYVRALRERILVYAADDGGVRADHVLKLWGVTFLRFHYRLRRKALQPAA